MSLDKQNIYKILNCKFLLFRAFISHVTSFILRFKRLHDRLTIRSLQFAVVIVDRRLESIHF